MKSLTQLGLSVMLLGTTVASAADSDSSIDAHIRRVVESLLKEKDAKIRQLEARIEQLANQTAPAFVKEAPERPFPAIISNDIPSSQNHTTSLVTKIAQLGTIILQLKQSSPLNNAVFNPNNHSSFISKIDGLGKGIAQMQHTAVQPQITEITSSLPPHSTHESPILSKLGELGSEVSDLKQKITEKGLAISGFFDVNAKTDNATNQNFSLGSVELDLEYAYNDHIAVSSALALCGNSSGAEYTAPSYITCGGAGPGGFGGGGAGIAVAFVDYHWFDSSIPPRGRIFSEKGLHFQAGRFDLPFSSDYQNYANKDRVTITAPITTSRMQFGGFKGDGIRSYGAWHHFNYSLFWTNAMRASEGSTLGGRLGMLLGQNTYRVHNANPDGLEFGISYLTDLDKNRDQIFSIYATDVSFGYHFLKFQSELMWKQAHNPFIDANDIDYGKPNEFGYHATLIADLESFIHHPILAFARYGRWQPSNRYTKDYDGSLIGINNVSALTLGLNYAFNDHFKLKFEYTDSLGTATQERYFDKKVGIAQMVVAF